MQMAMSCVIKNIAERISHPGMFQFDLLTIYGYVLRNQEYR